MQGILIDQKKIPIVKFGLFFGILIRQNDFSISKGEKIEDYN